jgi:hypothetical protein
MMSLVVMSLYRLAAPMAALFPSSLTNFSPISVVFSAESIICDPFLMCVKKRLLVSTVTFRNSTRKFFQAGV